MDRTAAAKPLSAGAYIDDVSQMSTIDGKTIEHKQSSAQMCIEEPKYIIANPSVSDSPVRRLEILSFDSNETQILYLPSVKEAASQSKQGEFFKYIFFLKRGRRNRSRGRSARDS
jgi:hypothetical protein